MHIASIGGLTLFNVLHQHLSSSVVLPAQLTASHTLVNEYLCYPFLLHICENGNMCFRINPTILAAVVPADSRLHLGMEKLRICLLTTLTLNLNNIQNTAGLLTSHKLLPPHCLYQVLILGDSYAEA